MQLFGTLADGRDVHVISLGHPDGLQAEVLTYGGILRRLTFPAIGAMHDIVLSLPDLAAYVGDTSFQGVIAGRVANRIEGARFKIDGREYRVTANDGPNHLHGGRLGFGKALWTVLDVDGRSRLRLGLRSPDGDEGYPGNVVVIAEFEVSESTLALSFEASCDQPTPVALTYHPYFNLGDEQLLCIPADRYVPVRDSGMIPIGVLEPVSGTPFDFRSHRAPAATTPLLHPQLKFAAGYDHCFVLQPSRAYDAELRSPATGIRLQVSSDQHGLQFYEGQHLGGDLAGICLEPGTFPNAVNTPAFGNVRLQPGELYRARIAYRLGSGG